MIPVPSHFQHIPRVAVPDSPVRSGLADSDHTFDSQAAAEELYGFCNPLAHAYALLKRPYNLVGVLLFQLVIGDVFTDKVMDKPLLLLQSHIPGLPDKAVHPPLQGLLVLPYLLFFKHVLRTHSHILGILRKPVMKTLRKKDFRVIQPETEKYIGKLPVFQPPHRKFRRNILKAGKHIPVGLLLIPAHLSVVIILCHLLFCLSRSLADSDTFHRRYPSSTQPAQCGIRLALLR